MSRRKRKAQRHEVAKMTPSSTYTVEDALEQARRARNGEEGHDDLGARLLRLARRRYPGDWEVRLPVPRSPIPDVVEDDHDHAIRVCRLCQACGAGPWDGPLLTAGELERLAGWVDGMEGERDLAAKLHRAAGRVRELAPKLHAPTSAGNLPPSGV